MTVSSTETRKSYSGDGSTTAFPFPYSFAVDADLKVILIDSDGVETTQTLSTHYTVTGAGEAAGGTVTMVTAPAVGEDLLIVLDPALTQTVDLVENEALPAETTEGALDKLTRIAQRLKARLDRTFQVSDGDTAVDMTLPLKADRASTYLAFDADGEPIASTGPTGDSAIPVSAFMETVLDDADAATARATLGAAGTGVDNAFTADQTITSDDSTNAIGPELSLKRDSASPADSDNIGRYRFDGKNSGGDDTLYAAVAAQVQDVTDGTEDAAILMQTMQAGTLTNAGVFEKGFRVGSPTGGDPGAGKINATEYQLNGVAIATGICFLAHKNGTDQTGIASATATMVTFSTTDLNVGDYFDTSTGKFTPPAGNYRLTASLTVAGGVVDGSAIVAAIYKDGVLHRQGTSVPGAVAAVTASVDAIVTTDGTKEFTVRVTAGGAGSKTVSGATVNTWFCGEAI